MELYLYSLQKQPLRFNRVAFNSPLFILYSSGTTGKPKCIVHSVGGITLNHLKEHKLHCDIRSDDRVFYYTTCGWMMWNWHVSALASGATLVIYDGNPVYPSEEVLWDLAERSSVTLFGTAAKYLEAIEKNGFIPNKKFALPHLKTLCSTGSVLYPEQFDYVYQAIKSDLHLASISGGTDICGCFVLVTLSLPSIEENAKLQDLVLMLTCLTPTESLFQKSAANSFVLIAFQINRSAFGMMTVNATTMLIGLTLSSVGVMVTMC
ncbi:acetoacetyl-CoA synthetase [Vibrio variabilis]|uniref:Acetoacetyl-CoA synthetase n=1 Tax=Vibrio variabilis TaxID=990271 RepID=A0ABQ0JBF5_9VIBR|nr:acetoacetyl-CoA synthetase [Vibrio variabilis]